MTDKEENFIKENSIIFKKYKIKKKLGEGAFGDVYMGTSIENNDLVAIKVEQRKIAKPLLETEAFFLYSLRGLGIPEVLSFGRLKGYNVLVEPLLDKSLFDIFAERRKRLALEDICLIAKQIIDRIQWVHSKNIVHRDIKPDNFLIGRKDPNVIYLIDFGLSKKYKSSTTGKHIRFGFTGKLTGTVRFASANALRGGEQSRRDDLESIGYMLIFFMRGKLPWQGVTGNKKMERYLKIYKMKKNVLPEDLCKSLPRQMTDFMRYVKQLEFEQDPDYNYLRNLFNSILKRIHDTNDLLVFSWIKMADLPNLKNPINPATRRDSPQSRLYRKIETKLKHERNTSSDNDSGQKSFQTCTMTMNTLNTNMKVIDNNLSKDEIEDIKLKTKKEKSKEGLNTMVANLNKTIDENIVDFGDEEKNNKIVSNDCRIDKMNNKINNNNSNYTKEKNRTLNEKLNRQNFTSFNSTAKKDDENGKEKSEEILKSNKENNAILNENKKNIQQNQSENHNINFKNDEKNINTNFEEKENNENNKLLNKIISEDNNIIIDKNKNNNKKDNKDNNISNINNMNNNEKNNNLENNNIIDKTYNIKENDINNNSNREKNNNNNINYNNIELNNHNTEIKKEKIKEHNDNIIQKKNNTKVKKLNDKNININYNPIDNDFFHYNIPQNNNNLVNNYNNAKKDTNSIQIKNYLRNKNNNFNIMKENKTNENNDININIPNNDGPNDNNRNNENQDIFQQINKAQFQQNIRVPMNEKIGNNSSKNVYNLNRNIKVKNISTDTNVLYSNKMIKSSKKIKNRYEKKNTEFLQNKNYALDLLPKNSENIIEAGSKDLLNSTEENKKNKINIFNNNLNLENYYMSDNFNEHKKKNKMISNSVNIFQDNIRINITNNMNTNNNKNNNFSNSQIGNSVNNAIKNTNMNNNNNNKINNLSNSKIGNNVNNANNNSNMNINNLKQKNKNLQNINYINANSNEKSNDNNYMNNNAQNQNVSNMVNNIEFNNNRKIRIVNRNRNPNINNISNNMSMNPIENNNNNIDYMNSHHQNKSKKKKIDNNNMNINSNNSINMNINNNINNNIIINNNINNNIYETASNNIFTNNSRNNYPQGINTSNYILNKRPSHNINSNIIHSFNNLNNFNQMEFNRRPSANIKTNNYISFNQMGVNKRPSYNTNVNVSNFLNNGIPMMLGHTKIKKLNNNNIIMNNQVQKIQNNNSVDKRLKIQQNQLNQMNINPNNTFNNGRPMYNLLNQYNLPNPSMNYQAYQNLKNKGQINPQGIINPSPILRNNAITENINNVPNFQNQIGNVPNQLNNNIQFYGYRNF